jgi:hypothetical protein
MVAEIIREAKEYVVSVQKGPADPMALWRKGEVFIGILWRIWRPDAANPPKHD